MTDVLCEFGMPGPLRDRLVAAVLQGEKTATSSLLVEWEQEGEALPTVGQHQLVVDSDGRGVATIEVVQIDVIRLGDADLRLAVDEGEQFETVDQWRDAHVRFWSEHSLPNLPEHLGYSLTDDSRVVVERFRLVEHDATATDARQAPNA
jgi:uncharacterized protein YhfF